MDKERVYYNKLVHSKNRKACILHDIDQLMSDNDIDDELADILRNCYTNLECRLDEIKDELDNDFEKEKKEWFGKEDSMDVYHRHVEV